MAALTIKDTFAACGASHGEVDALFDIVCLRTDEDLHILTKTDVMEMCKLHNKNVDLFPHVPMEAAMVNVAAVAAVPQAAAVAEGEARGSQDRGRPRHDCQAQFPPLVHARTMEQLLDWWNISMEVLKK
jgi:hypothetical protein